MAIHSSILAWRIPWTEEPGRLQPMGLQRVGHDWACSKVNSPNFQMRKLKPRVPSLIKWVQGQYLLFWGLNWNNRCRMLHILYSMYIYCCCLITKSCLILCDPMDCSPPGSFIYGIFQARILEWIAIPFSRGSSQPRDWTQFSCIADRFFTMSHQRYQVLYLHLFSQASLSPWVSPIGNLPIFSRVMDSTAY